MLYQKIYDNLIAVARRSPPDGYCEIHHILPRCLGGLNNQENLIALSARQHFVAHQLLAKIHGGKLFHAAWMMSQDRKYTSRKHDWLRKGHAENTAKRMKGNKHGEKLKGSKRSPEAIKHVRESQPRAQISASMKALWEKRHAEGYKQAPHKASRSTEYREKMAQKMKGHSVSEETRAKIRASVLAGLANRKPYPAHRKSRKAACQAPEQSDSISA